MEENTSYRKLHNLRPISISATSPRLLQSTFRLRSQNKKGEKKEDIMCQNVLQYQYMLKDPHLKETYIHWAINLRSYVKPEPSDEDDTSGGPPSAFFKDTQGGQIRKREKEKFKTLNMNTAQYSQFFGKESKALPESQLDYVNELRKFKFLNKENEQCILKHKKNFHNFGLNDKQNIPKLLKKSAIKKLGQLQTSDFESGLDGTHNYPEYTYKNLRDKNSAMLLALSSSAKGISLPALTWTVGLRNYQ